MASGPHVCGDGSLYIRPHLVIDASEVHLRVTTSGGPGGQHANRSLTKVVASFHVATSTSLSESERAQMLAAVGAVVRSSASRFRSQSQNRAAALEQLAARIARALVREAPRRPTRPTRASQERRVEAKKLRARTKEQRRAPRED